MADNVAITAGSGTTIAADDIGGVLHQRVKISQGADGSATDVSSAAPLQVTLANTGANTNKLLVTPDLPTGASTAAKQPALGTAGTASTDVITIQGIAAMTKLLVTPDLPSGASTAANQTTIIGHVDGIETVLGTIDADTGAIKTATEAIQAGQLADGHNVTVDNASGVAAVNIQDGGNTITVDGTVAVTNAGITTIAGAVSGTEMQVDVLTMPTVTVTATNLDVQSGGADLATSAQGAAIQTAVEIIDNAISGSEMQVDVVGALPAGSNAIGKLAANSGVDIGDVTLTAGTAAIGTLLPPDIDVTTHTNYAKKYYTNAGAVTDGIVWSPAAGKRFHIVSLFVNVSAAATITFEDDKAGGDEAILKMELAANSGTVIPFPDKYPLASGEDAADLIITTTAGNVYVTCVGYEI